MIIVEAILIAILCMMLVHTVTTDLKNGKISNRTLAFTTGIAVVVDVIYYAFFAVDYLLLFGVNLLLSVVMGLLLYWLGIWGAGDSKMAIVVFLSIPARIYSSNNFSLGTGFVFFALVFIAAFLYVVVETIILGLKDKSLFKIQKPHFNLKNYIKGFLSIFFVLNIVDGILLALYPYVFGQDAILLTAINIMVVLATVHFERRIGWLVVAILAAIWGVMLLVGLSRINLQHIDFRSYVVVALLLVFRLIADKYNYRTIPVSDLNAGMILSMGTVLSFSASRVKGLPEGTTEDLKSRITPEEVESVCRWSQTSKGKDTVVIVKKIPFAIFISLGAILFIVLEVLL